MIKVKNIGWLLFFAFYTVSAQLPKKCIDEILALPDKNPKFDAVDFLKELSITVVKVKAQLLLPFGKPKDDKVTDIGVTVGCIKVFPESPAALAIAVKDIGIELAKKTGAKAIKGAIGESDDEEDDDPADGAATGRAAAGRAAAPAQTGPVLKKCDFVFNPERKFCYDGAAYDKCDGMEYNPTTHICMGEIAQRALCDNVQYNPVIQRCGKDNAIEMKCTEDTWYNPATHACYNKSKIIAKCGMNPQVYDPDFYECKPGVNVNGIFLKTPTKHGNEEYEGLLIGEQVWLSRNLAGEAFDLETARTACPASWYLPSDAEWTKLTNYVGQSSAGEKLKAKNFGGSDIYGFAAVLGAGETGGLWSSSESGSETVYSWSVNRGNLASRGSVVKSSKLGIRCIYYADGWNRKTSFPLNIVSNPAGAVLKFNGISSPSCPKTPCKVELKEGKYNINLALNLYEPIDTTIVITGDKYLNLRPVATFGTLSIKDPGFSDGIGSSFPWNFTINDKPSPFGDLRFMPGKLALKLTHDCYEDIVDSVVIKKDARVDFNVAKRVALRKSNLILKSEYKGREASDYVFVNGTDFGKTPFSGPVPLCSQIAIVDQNNFIEINLLEDKPVEYTHKKSTFVSIFLGATLNLAGAIFFGLGIAANSEANDNYDSYSKLGIHAPQSHFNTHWENYEQKKKDRNINYIIGSILFASGIGAYIWF